MEIRSTDGVDLTYPGLDVEITDSGASATRALVHQYFVGEAM